MRSKPIIKPSVPETFFYGELTDFKFRHAITPERGKYSIRGEAVFLNGQKCPFQFSGYQTKAEAYQAREVFRESIIKRTFIPFHYKVSEFYDYWLYYVLIDEKKCAYSTFMSYRNAVTNYILPVIGEKKLEDITVKNILKILMPIESPDKFKMVSIVLKTSFRYALNKNFINCNVCPQAVKIAASKKKMVRIGNANHLDYSAEPPKQRPVLSVPQVALLLQSCREKEKEIYMMLLLSVATGARISEVIGMKYGDVDFGGKTIRIQRNLGRKLNDDRTEDLCIQEKRCKTPNAYRTIPIPDFVLDEIILERKKYEDQRFLSEEFYDLDYICCHQNGKPYTRTFKDKPFKRLLALLGITDGFHWHDLRHTYATILKNNQVNLKAISIALGHGKPEFSDKVYIAKEEPVYDFSHIMDKYARRVLPAKETEKILVIKFRPEFLEDILPA